ncbi:MAG: ATP synthase F1 subunit epsilon [Erysipelotrichaceae bacterium]|nr:ATP synthase F1 subunit epsilon [Erysipelotrichaceae bacterium]
MITVKMITPEGLYKTVHTKILNVDTIDGQRGILPNHMPIVLMLKIGVMSTEEEGIRNRYTVSGGMLYFENNVATVLSDSIENVKDIDVGRAQRARDRAEQRLKKGSKDLDVRRAEVALQRALNRIKASEK